MAYIIKRIGDFQVFAGFRSIHPGSKPTGYTKAEWSNRIAFLVMDEELEETRRDLVALGDTNIAVIKVEL